MTKSSPSIWHLLHNVKSTVKILSNFVAFLENINFKSPTFWGFVVFNTIAKGFQPHWAHYWTCPLLTDGTLCCRLRLFLSSIMLLAERLTLISRCLTCLKNVYSFLDFLLFMLLKNTKKWANDSSSFFLTQQKFPGIQVCICGLKVWNYLLMSKIFKDFCCSI